MPQGRWLVALCFACALVGAAAALLVETRGAPGSPGDEHATLAQAVDRLARQIAELERRTAAREPAPGLATATHPAPVSPSSSPTDSPRSTGAGPSARAPVPEDEIRVRRGANDPPLPPKNRERVNDVGMWADFDDEESAALRARWLLASERAVLDWFGAPDGIWAHESGERWEYLRLVRGVRRNLNIYLLRGRVVRMLP